MATPTNTDIIREVRQIKRENSDMLTMIKDHENRIRPLENWKIAYEAAVKALEGAQTPGGITTINKDFVNVILKFLTLATALVGLLYLVVDKLVK